LADTVLIGPRFLFLNGSPVLHIVRGKLQGLDHRREVSSTLSTAVHCVSTTGRVVTSTVNDTGARVDVGLVVEVHASISPALELVHVCKAILIDIRLDRVEPVEESCDPLERGWRSRLADCLRVFAEIDGRVQRIAAVVFATFADEPVEFAEIADTSCLDDSTWVLWAP